MHTLTFVWDDGGESFDVQLDGEHIITSDHDEHGWSGMTGIHNAFVKVAQTAGWTIVDVGNPCV